MVKTNKQCEQEKRREGVANLYLQGKSQRFIAEKLQTSLGTVNRDLTTLRNQWKKNAAADMDEAIGRELAKLDKLEEQAWESYFLSLKTTQTHNGQNSRPGQKKGERAKKSTSQNITITETAGDPRFLNIVENCIERRCKILGIDAPGKVEVTGKNGGPMEFKDKSNAVISTLAELLKAQNIPLQDEDEEPEEEK